jgi:hypothetical protein
MNKIEEEFNTSTILHEKRNFSSDEEDEQLSMSAKSKLSQHRERLSKYAHLLQGGGALIQNNENAYDGGSSAG